MGGHPLNLRLPESTVERLAVRAQRMQLSPRELAQRYVEEGLRGGSGGVGAVKLLMDEMRSPLIARVGWRAPAFEGLLRG